MKDAIAPGTGATRTSRGRPVFLLEDNDANGEVMVGLLSLLGYRDVHWVRTLSEAQDYLANLLNGSFEIVLLDIMLPDGESFDFLGTLKRRGVDNLCMYTARTSPDDYARLGRFGCDNVIEKPVTLASLRKGLCRLFPEAPAGAGH